MKDISLRIMKFRDSLEKSEFDGPDPEGIFFQIGVSGPGAKEFQLVNVLLDTGLTGKVPLALTAETAKKLNLSPTTKQTQAQLGDGRTESMATATVDIQIEGVYIRGIPTIVGATPINLMGFRLMRLLNLYIKGGEVAHVELNEGALRYNLDGPA